MRSNIINSLRPAALALCAVAALLCAREAQADTFTVTAIIDAPDAVPGDGKCETGPGNGVCTLRAAVMEANALAGEDVISLPVDNFVLTRIGEDATALNGDLDITGRLTIRGVQSDTTQVIGGTSFGDRILELQPQAIVTMTDFTVRNGDGKFPAGSLTCDCRGGGIHVSEGAELVLENMVLRENQSQDVGGAIASDGKVHMRRSVILSNASSRLGGGIYASSVSQLTLIEDSIIRDNRASSATGGGIYAQRNATILRSTIQGNEAPFGAGIAAFDFLIVTDSGIFSNTSTSDFDPINNVGGGGGVLLSGGLIADSHIAWNSAVGIGGGVATSSSGNATTITIVRTTISNNRANATGGGIHTRHQLPFYLIDSAVVDNSAITGGGIYRSGGGINVINTTVSGNVAAGRGGGIALELNICTGFCEVGLYNATVANNAAASASDGVYIVPGLQLRAQNSIIANNNDADCEGTILSGGYNLIENTAGCSFLGLAIFDVLGVDPKLGRLALNGGPTLNHLPGRDSPAINAGNPGGCSSPAGATLVTDQRGLPRTAGRRCDIGAVEVQPEAAPEWLVFLPIVMR